MICYYVPIYHNFFFVNELMDLMSLKNIVLLSSTIKSMTMSVTAIIKALYKYSHKEAAMVSHSSRALPFINVAI